MQLSRLVYASSRQDRAPETLDAILQVSRINNTRDHISGALVVDENFYLQVIEGDRSAVARCFLRISQDHRHEDIRIIYSGDAENRLFGEWRMHRIDTSHIKQDILKRYNPSGRLDPAEMSQVAVEDLCRVLSQEEWQANAA